MRNITQKKIILLLFFLLAGFFHSGIYAQRKMEKLDRGVVAVRNGSGNYFISWRFFATDPEGIQFNLYAKTTGAGYAKLNNTPLTVTNFSPATGTVGAGTQYYVTPVINGVEGTPSGIFKAPTTGAASTYRSTFVDITYNPALDGLDIAHYSTRYVLPVDLDGDGEYDYVVDRRGTTRLLQAYLRTGQLLWTVDLGPNVCISSGATDMFVAYDMDGDGKGEVVTKSSDGTKFANGLGVFGSTTLDTDNDGIIDYEAQSVRNSPQYISVIDGMTGVEKNSIEMKYPYPFTRDNKANFMSDQEFHNLNGRMGIIYIDGKHPALGYIFKSRDITGYHWYSAAAYGYDKSGNWVNFYNWDRGSLNGEGHSIRVADVDLDGRDELLDLSYGIRYDGTTVFKAPVSHGDRYRVGDLDPDRPGLETYAIQQNNPTMLGQLLFDAATGEPIKKYYMGGVGDVGRGECMDIDSTHFGNEFWSTMPNIYDSKGNITYEGAGPFPYEGVWWDGDLARETLGGTETSTSVLKYKPSSHSWESILDIGKMAKVECEDGVRPMFFGDITGDWREEVILRKRGSAVVDTTTYITNAGFIGFSTDFPTDKRIYCLMQNPAYRSQSTCHGYYQSPLTDYYLGYNMPTPPIAPVQKAKLTWTSGTTFDKTSTNFVLEDEKTTSAFTDGDDVMFDISGNNSSGIQISSDIAPSKIWAINPLGHDFTFSGPGKLTGNMELVKSLNGSFILNGDHTYTGKTTISEGSVFVNGSLVSPVVVLAKGTLGGNAVINGGITLNSGLNVEGGRLAPGNGLASGKLGKIIINSDVTMGGKVNVQIDVLPFDPYKNDSLIINGNLTLTGVNKVVVNTESGILPPGTYSLIHWTGTLTGSLANFEIAQLNGIAAALVLEDNTLKLVVNSTRSAGSVTWTGKENTNWDFLSANFKLNTDPTYFVNSDAVLFNDSAIVKTVTLTDNMTTASTTFNNNTAYVLNGTGGITGSGDLVKTGRGLLDIQTTNNTYTGKTLLNNTIVQVAALGDSAVASSFGAATKAAGYFVMTNSRLQINAVSTNSNRNITLIGSDTITVPKSNGVVTISGVINGDAKLVKIGPGQLTFASKVANTYSGGTVVDGGILALGTVLMNTSGLGTGPITLLNGGRIKMFAITSDYSQKPNWDITIPAGHNGTLNASGRCSISGTISGAGTFNYSVPNYRNDLIAGGANFTGFMNVTGSDFRITNNTQSFPYAGINLGSGVAMAAFTSIGGSSSNSSQVVNIGSLSSSDATASVGGGKWMIGTDNRDAVFNGVLGSGATVTKLGTGKWTLTNASTTTGVFTVSGGTLNVQNTTGSATGTGSVSISNAAILSGTGIISGAVTFSNTAKVMPGNSETTTGTLSFGSNVTLTADNTTVIKVNSVINGQLKVTGTLNLNGALEMKNLVGAWQVGKSYTIFTAASITGNFTSISPSIPAVGLKWNTSRITQGIISIDLADGIEDVSGINIRVYPSQVKDYCIVEFGGGNGDVKVELIDQVGKILMSDKTSTSENYRFDMSNLHSGFYFVRIINDKNHSFLRKVIKL